MSMASSPFPARRDRQSPSAGRPPEPREANAPSPAMPQRRRSGIWPAQLARYQQGSSHDCRHPYLCRYHQPPAARRALHQPTGDPRRLAGRRAGRRRGGRRLHRRPVPLADAQAQRPPFADSLRRPAARGTYRMRRVGAVLVGFQSEPGGALAPRPRRDPPQQSRRPGGGARPRRPRPLAGPQGAAEGTGRLVQRRSRVHPPPRQQAQPGLVCLRSAAATRVSPARPRSFPRTAGATATMRSGASPRKICCASTTSSAARYGARSRPARPAQRYSTGPRSWACNGSGRNTREAGRRPLPPRREASAQPR